MSNIHVYCAVDCTEQTNGKHHKISACNGVVYTFDWRGENPIQAMPASREVAGVRPSAEHRNTHYGATHACTASLAVAVDGSACGHSARSSNDQLSHYPGRPASGLPEDASASPEHDWALYRQQRAGISDLHGSRVCRERSDSRSCRQTVSFPLFGN